MKNFTNYFLVLVLGLVMSSNADAQKRYLESSFDVEVSEVQFAGSNYTVLPWLFGGNTMEQPLVYQVYSPADDTETERPLVLYLHTGNFFPFPLNGACGGTLTDSTNVAIATQLASMGYVVALADYRVGWAPTHPQELVRRYTLINGAYRGAQDVNTFIRYFKRSIQEEGNRFGIDGNKITVWGQGTGGYLSLAAAFLNDYDEINETSDPSKFQLPTSATTSVSMILPPYNGNISGTNEITVVDSTYNMLSGIPVGDTLSKPNWQDYTDDDFALAVNMGGALGDSLWISDNDNDIPVISYHVPTDPFAPYETDVLLVNTADGAQPVVEVSGSYHVQRIATRMGNNDIFTTIPEGNDPVGDAINPEFPGLFELNNTPNDTSAPWEWTDPDTPGLTATDCNFDGVVATTYIDSIVGFFAPRACVALDLNCDFTTSTKEVNLDNELVTITPNPASLGFTLTTENMIIENVQIFTIVGQLAKSINNVNDTSLRVDRGNLKTGTYLVKTKVADGIITQKVIIR